MATVNENYPSGLDRLDKPISSQTSLHLMPKPNSKQLIYKANEGLQVGDDEAKHHLTGPKLWLIILGLSLSVLLIVLVCQTARVFYTLLIV